MQPESKQLKKEVGHITNTPTYDLLLDIPGVFVCADSAVVSTVL